MNSNTLSNLWLIGASPMAQDYARVLKALDSPFKVIGRGENSAREFESEMGIPAQIGGIEKALQNELSKLDINDMTPMDALTKLDELKNKHGL